MWIKSVDESSVVDFNRLVQRYCLINVILSNISSNIITNDPVILMQVQTFEQFGLLPNTKVMTNQSP